MKCHHLTTAIFAGIFSLTVSSQTNTYILNGSATQNNCNCYTLTTDELNKSGSVWNANKIDLRNSFDFTFNVYLGCKDANGADGIVFILQPISTSLGGVGGGMGFQGVSPSVGITLDTWQNVELNDPAYDHISIQANGVTAHTATDLAAAVQASITNANIEDCQWHTFRITWDPPAGTLSTYFDGVFRTAAHVDLVGSIFNNDPMVYWGFSSATGGASNLQQFCTALNPKFNENLPAGGGCTGVPLQLIDQSESFAPITAYYWNFGDGNTSTLADPPPHSYTQAGEYNIKLAIKGLDGCNSDTLNKTITIGSIPHADFEVFDTCFKKIPRLLLPSEIFYGITHEWKLNGNPFPSTLSSALNPPPLDALQPGPYQLELTLVSAYGCGPTDQLQKQFIIKSLPLLDATIKNGCVKEDILFKAVQIDNATNIINWNWHFNDGKQSDQQNRVWRFDRSGNYDVQLWGIADNGCSSDTLFKTFFINKAFADAGNDTLVLKNNSFQLHGRGNGDFLWAPSFGLNDNGIPDPTCITDKDQRYTLTVTTPEGCIATDIVSIEVFKGSSVFVPNAFTPDHDGLNDIFMPGYKGIKKLHNFTVYNRWGQLMFTTNNIGKGWDGSFQNVIQSAGSFVWMLKAEDYEGKIYQMKGTVTLIR